MKPWPKVSLGDVLTRVEREEKVDASQEYRLLGIRLEGQGPFLRETVMGTQTSATKLFRVATGDFIYSRLFACVVHLESLPKNWMPAMSPASFRHSFQCRARWMSSF